MNDESRPKAAHETPATASTGMVRLDEAFELLLDEWVEDGSHGPNAEALRDAGFRQTTAASDDQEVAVIDQAIRAQYEVHGHTNANLIRHLLPSVRPALIGARFLALAKQGRLERIGLVKATHAVGRGRYIADWRWVSEQQASCG